MKSRRLIFVTGGNLSSLGKGIASASVGRLMKARGYSVTMIKMDPYLNVDAGTMSPYQHGEVFVTDDGAETDLDLGHYERFVERNLTANNNITSGKIYSEVIAKERRGDYLGATVQVIPHITDQIKRSILQAVAEADAEIGVVEVGGTVGDIESGAFIEAIRQLRKDLGADRVAYIHLTYVPMLESSGEQKTKLTQHSVKELRGMGIQPDVIIARCAQPLEKSVRAKISLFCDIPEDAVINGVNMNNIYRIPLEYEEQGLGEIITRRLRLEERRPNLEDWREMVRRCEEPVGQVEIAVVGKYTRLRDAYISLHEALRHAGAATEHFVKVHWIDAEAVEREGPEGLLKGMAGIVVPGGFDVRGSEGKFSAIRYARENGIPFLGLCLGLQCAVIEFARNVAGLKGANSTEFDPHTPYPVIDLIPEQRGISDKGATMRRGGYPCRLQRGSLAAKLYGKEVIRERHRHRYEVNNDDVKTLEKYGLRFTGYYEEKGLAEVVELPGHPFFIATQYHPEFLSRPLSPHPLFVGFINAALGRVPGVSPAPPRHKAEPGTPRFPLGESALK
ncbi:MAG: CTP synthase [bacterium JZ-2024 1]